jgi:predicted ArsR family transcriptional regulator
MARPRIKGVLIIRWLAERRRGTARDVAHGLQLSVADASLQLHRLERAGEVARLGQVSVEHAKRPVALFGPVAQQQRGAIFSDDWLR